MTALLALRTAELDAKRASLRSELDDWQAMTEKEVPWRRHRSQLRRLRLWLEPILDAPAAPPPVTWPGIADAEPRILAAHSIWEAYRAKLVLRFATPFRNALWLADDFAWACYEPVQALKPEADRREPPMLFFSATWSPYVRVRDTNLLNELRFADSRVAGVLEDDEYRRVVDRLPVPLISVPWYQLAHPPSMGVIAHEVGHVVYRELALAGAVGAAMTAVGGALSDDLQRWAEEMFADVYGCAAGRQAFAGSMLELLAADPSEMDRPAPGMHPPRWLRAELLLAALDRLGHADEAGLLAKRWTEAYGPFDPGSQAAAVVDRLLDLEVAGKPLRAIFAAPGGARVLAEKATRAGVTLDMRTLDARAAVFAARLLHEGRVTGGALPPRAQLARYFERLVDYVGQLEVGFRSVRGVFATAADQEAALQAQDAEDRRRAARFWDEGQAGMGMS